MKLVVKMPEGSSEFSSKVLGEKIHPSAEISGTFARTFACLVAGSDEFVRKKLTTKTPMTKDAANNETCLNITRLKI